VFRHESRLGSYKVGAALARQQLAINARIADHHIQTFAQ
jgi:hypothetical protein